MAKDNSRDLDLAHAFAGVLSGREFGDLKIKVGQKIGYDESTDTMTLPGIPFGEIPEDLKEDLRAYIAHESIGERGHSHWNPKDYPDEQLKAIINGMNDARVDRIALNEWPGAGMSIRSRVQLDWEEFQKHMLSGRLDPQDPGVLSSALRYIGENVASVEEVAGTSPEMAKLLKKIQPALSGTDFDGSEKHIIEQAKEVHRLANLKEPPPSLNRPDPQQGEGGEGEEGNDSQDGSEGSQDDSGDGKEGKAGDSESDREGKAQKESFGKESKEANSKGEKGKAAAGGAQKQKWGNMEERLMDKLTMQLDPIKTPKEKAVFTVPPNSIKRHAPGTYSVGTSYHGWEGGRNVALIGRIMRLFRSLQAAEDRVILKHRLLGELDPDRLADIHRGSERLFSARKRGETESLVVYISVDLTGSINRHWSRALKGLVLALNEALGRLEIPVAIVGWYGNDRVTYTGDWSQFTMGYESHLLDMKEFDTPWKKAERVISHTDAGIYNADVPAIADGISQLARRRETRKLFFFLTDGLPCLDNDRDPEKRALLGRTMADIVQRGKKAGITTVACGIGLQPLSALTMDRIFGEGNYAVIAEDPAMMADSVGAEFEKVVKRIVHYTERGMR